MGQIEHLKHLVQTFNWHSPSWDLLILLFWLVASTMYAFAAGRGKIMTILVSIFMAKLLVLEAPFLSTAVSQKLNISVLSMQQLITFAILFLLLFIFLSRYAFKTAVDGRQISALPFTLIFAFFQIGLLVNIVLGLLPVTISNNFGELIHFIFINKTANFVWLILPVVFLVVLGKHISERHEI